MLSRFDRSDSGINRVFTDVVLAALMTVAAVTMLLFLLPKMPSEADAENQRARGNIRVEVFWPNEMDVDIDLWSKAPGLAPVGYSNMNGVVMNLVRDDLGKYADISQVNYEVAFSRGLPQGEWQFNLHWFSNSQGVSEVPVRVIITHRRDDGDGSKEKPTKVVATTVTLTQVKQELTIIRFELDKDGNLMPETYNSVPRAIRPAGRAGPGIP